MDSWMDNCTVWTNVGITDTGIYQVLYGAPGRIRTCDTRFRKPMLYPLSYGSGNRPRRLSTAAVGRAVARLVFVQPLCEVQAFENELNG